MRRSAHLLLIGGFALLASVLGLMLAGCGGDDGNGGAAPTQDDGTPDGQDGDATIPITLLEWTIHGEEDDSLTAVPSGGVTFEVENIGLTPHDFVVIKTDKDSADLAVDQGIVIEDEAGEVIGRTSPVDGGDNATLELTLEAGNYVLICNLPAHYEQGMYANMTVR